MAVRHIIWRCLPEQSNGIGAYPGGSGLQTLAAVPYYDVWLDMFDSDELHDLNDTHGSDFELGKTLYQEGYAPIIVNVGKGGTFANQWIPNHPYYLAAIDELTNAWTKIRQAFPGDSFIHHHVVDQGEQEIRYADGGVQASQWAATVATSRAGLVGIIGETPHIWIAKTKSDYPDGLWPAIMGAQQLLAAGSPSHLLERDHYPVSGLHFTTPGLIQYGRDLAALIIAGVPMGTISTYLKNAKLNHLRNKAAYTPAANHYCAAFVAGVEVTGNGYARASAANNTTTWPNASSRTKSNGVAFNFPAASGGNWGTVDEIRIYDASSGGNELARHTLSVAQSVVNGGPPLTIAPGAISIVIAAGGYTDAVVHALLNLAFGGTAYTQLTTTYGSYWAGNPQSGGSQAGSRVAITQATTWNNASGGISTTSADISIPDQVTGTYWAEHDASSGGNLLFSGLLGAAPAGGKMAAGTLRTLFT